MSRSGRRRSSARARCLTTIFVAALLPAIHAQAKAEPAGNQILLGAWLDTEAGMTPLEYNQLTGQNFSYFQLTQNMPLPAYDYVTGTGGQPPEWMIDQSQTDAGVFLTVYPQTFALADTDYDLLISQLKNYTGQRFNRTTFLRFAPEMQGTWMPYGFQPVAFVQMWKDMYTRVKAAVPEVIIVWAPNLGVGYPYGQTSPTNATELAALDTSGDGTITDADEAFAPFYPGDEYVDWIGLSIYYKGPNYQDINTPQDGGYCAAVIQNIDNTNGANLQLPENFYEVYCTKANVACMFAESGAAYHVDAVGTGTQLALESAWVADCINNDTFLDMFPRLKMIMQFEFEKSETVATGDDLRDYRLSNDTGILSMWSDSLESISTRVQWAQSRALPVNVPSSGVPATVTGGAAISTCSKYCGVVTFHTQRAFLPNVPTLFGDTRSAAIRVQASVAVGFITIGMVGAASWLGGRRRQQLTS